MNTVKYIGIDVHQATSVFAVMNHQGRMVGEAILETKTQVISDFLKSQRGTLWVTFEEGTYANWLYDVISLAWPNSSCAIQGRTNWMETRRIRLMPKGWRICCA